MSLLNKARIIVFCVKTLEVMGERKVPTLAPTHYEPESLQFVFKIYKIHKKSVQEN